MTIQNSALTINQEKQLRALRKKTLSGPAEDAAFALLPTYIRLAKAVFKYRQAQMTLGGDSANIRKKALDEIDSCLEALGMK